MPYLLVTKTVEIFIKEAKRSCSFSCSSWRRRSSSSLCSF